MRWIGFTGSRYGMTDAQGKRFLELLECYLLDHSSAGIIHGGCVGADFECHNLALAYGMKVRVHPASNVAAKWVAIITANEAEFIAPPAPALERNRRIVQECEYLIATPYTAQRVRRSGTWATIDYAIAAGKPVTIIRPDGSVVPCNEETKPR